MVAEAGSRASRRDAEWRVLMQAPLARGPAKERARKGLLRGSEDRRTEGAMEGQNHQGFEGEQVKTALEAKAPEVGQGWRGQGRRPDDIDSCSTHTLKRNRKKMTRDMYTRPT